jgi:hypothetical protein
MSRFIARRKFVVLATALIALAFGVSVGLAKSGPSQWKVPLLLTNKNCGNKFSSKKPAAWAHVERSKGTVTVHGQAHGAIPGHYLLQIWDPSNGGCTLIDTIDEFKVDGSGDGNFAGATFFTSPQTIIVSMFNSDLGFYNDSPSFWLGSS